MPFSPTLSTFCCSDLRFKAKRWDEKNVEAMKKKRNECMTQLKELAADRRKRPTLDNLKSQVDGLKIRLQYTQREVESNVCITNISFFSIMYDETLKKIKMGRYVANT